MKFLLVQPESSFGYGITCAKGTFAEMQAQKQPGQHIVALLHERVYRYDIGEECLYYTYKDGYLTPDGLADGATCYVDTTGT